MLSVVSLIARLVLAAVSAVAGWAKLSDQAGTRDAVMALGAPGTLSRPLAQPIERSHGEPKRYRQR